MPGNEISAITMAVGWLDTAAMSQSATAALVSRVSVARGGVEYASRLQLTQLQRCQPDFPHDNPAEKL